LGETAAKEAFARLSVQSFIGWSAQDASLLVDAKIAVRSIKARTSQPDLANQIHVILHLGPSNPKDFDRACVRVESKRF
jgi:hypothetical protein